MAKIMVEELHFTKCPSLNLFNQPSFFPALKTIEIQDCSTVKVDFTDIEVPRLEHFLLEDSRKIQVLGIKPILGTLQHIRIKDCKKVWFPDADLALIRKHKGFEFIKPKSPTLMPTSSEMAEWDADIRSIEEDSVAISQEFRFLLLIIADKLGGHRIYNVRGFL